MKLLNIAETNYYQIPVPDEFPDEGTEGFHEAASVAWFSIPSDEEESYFISAHVEKYSLE